MNLLATNFKLHHKRVLLVILLGVALILVACRGDARQNPPAEPPQAVAADTLAIRAENQKVESEESSTSSQGVLRVAMQPVVNIDPIAISSDSEVLVANHVYDYLVDVDPQSNPIPRLATKWEASDDGLTYVFTLAQGITWHDGSPFSAKDVVWTFDRLRRTAGTPTADLYQNIKTIEVTGDLEVTFTLTQPNPFFLYDLSDNHALMLKEGTTDVDKNFNGTGPFIVTNYSPEDRIEMKANENYFIQGEPHLAGLEIIFFNDEAASVEALRSGQIDLVIRLSTSLFKSLQGEPNIVTVDIPTNGFDLIRLRADREPGNDPQVIQALKLATDREAIFNVVQQGYGALGNDTPIGPLYTNYYDKQAILPARDVEAARKLLAEAGYSDGLKMTLHTSDTGGRPDLAAVLKQQWAEVGVELEISVEPESVYYGDTGWLDVDLGITSWGSRPYPQFYLDTMLVSGAKWNESQFSNPEFDKLAKTAGTTLDEPERIQAYRDIQKLLIDQGPIIVPYFFAQFGAISNQFDGLALKAFAGRTDFRTITFKGTP